MRVNTFIFPGISRAPGYSDSRLCLSAGCKGTEDVQGLEATSANFLRKVVLGIQKDKKAVLLSSTNAKLSV